MNMKVTRIMGTTVLIGIVVLLSAWVFVGYQSVAGVEKAAYTVVREADGYEVRAYPAHIVAQVTVEGPLDKSMNQGFRLLADYIFGNNTKQPEGGKAEKIAMTAPVLEQAAPSEKIAMTAPVLEQAEEAKEGNTRVVSFVMPASYTMDTLPTPVNPEVRLVEVPPATFAVLRFSGFAGEAKADKKKAELLRLLKEAGVEVLGEPMLAQYNPPWTPPFMRRNEVLAEIETETPAPVQE